MSILRRYWILPLVAALAATTALAARTPPPQPVAFTLAPLFADHAVLQRDRPVPVWGTATPGDKVTVSFHGQKLKAVAGPDGRWMVHLKPLGASAEPADLVVSGRTVIVSHDVVVGEVWLCSGQSNMEFKVDDGGTTYRVKNSKAEIAGAQFPLIRQLEVVRTVGAAPATSVETKGWIPATPGTVGHFTAVGYFFARDIYHAVGVPVGIILSAWGGTPVEAWMSDAARASTPYSAAIDERWQKEIAAWPPERVAKYGETYAAWQKANDEAVTHHTKNPLPWPSPPATASSPNRPGTLYNGMISPLLPVAMRGILWYQGESNTGRASEYAALFGSMITSWRAAFGQGDLPFYFVQLANFGEGANFAHRDWAQLRDAQTETLTLPATGMAVTVDIGEADNIHPRNKQELGRRLALIARANLYHVPPDWQGPTFASAVPEGAALRVRFTHAGNELTAPNDAVAGLEVAGADQVFHPATARIETDTLLVSSPDVSSPVAVRYAWTNAPTANLYSDDGLPAVPFRSDNW